MKRQIILFLFMTVSLSSIGQISCSATSTCEYCGQSNGTVTVIAWGGTGTYTYLWNTVPPQTTSTVSNLPAGTYTVTVSDGIDTATTTVTIMNVPGPDAAFTTSIYGLNVEIFCHSSGNIVCWYWDYGFDCFDSTCYTLTDSSIIVTYPAPGNYTICLIVTDNNGCVDTSCISTSLSTIDSSIYDPVLIFPNPSSGIFTIITNQNSTIEIFNLDGQIIRSINSINKSKIVDLSDLSCGLYLVKVNSDKGVFIKEIFIE